MAGACGVGRRSVQVRKRAAELFGGRSLPPLRASSLPACIFETGFGYAFDFALAVVVAAVAIPLIMLAVALLLTIARKLPRMATGMIAGSCAIVMVIWGPPQLGVVMAIAIGLAEGVLGATIATFVAGSFRQAGLAKKIINVSLCVLAVAANIVFVWLFVHEGSMEKLISWKPPANTMPAKLAAPNPSENGPYRVKMLFYSAGTDIRRPEYGSSAAIKTRTVDASRFFEDFKGWKRWARKKYWGFDVDKLPLNARVWYPEGPGPFPLALIVHGNHNMAEFSDPGYEYLGRIAGQPRLHPGVGRRELPEQRPIPRSSEAAGSARLDTARASEAVARMESGGGQSVSREGGPFAHRADGALAGWGSGGHRGGVQSHEVRPGRREHPVRLRIRHQSPSSPSRRRTGNTNRRDSTAGSKTSVT